MTHRSSLLRALVIGLLSVGAALPAFAQTNSEVMRPVSPTSARYQLVIPAGWYDSRSFESAFIDPGDSLYLAADEVVFEAWRNGEIIGPILQITATSVEGRPASDVETILLDAVAPLTRASYSPELDTLAGFPSVSVDGFPYRDASHVAISVVYTDDTLFQFLHAGHDETAFQAANDVLRSFALLNDVDTGALPGIRDLAAGAAEVGQPAPDFNLPAYDGEPGELIALGDYRGQTVIISFWATWCIPCQRELPLLQGEVEGRDDAAVIAVNFREAPGVIRQFVDEWNIDLPIALDRAGFVADLYDVQAYPTNLIIDGNGIVRMIPTFTPETTAEDIEGWLADVAQAS